MKQRLDSAMTALGLVKTRSEASSWIGLGKVRVNGKSITKSGHMVQPNDDIKLSAPERYVSRAGLKLASVAGSFKIDFMNKVILDVGSSTGGFTDYALQHDAHKVVAVDVGTDQMHPSLRTDPRVELHEKTDIRQFTPTQNIDIVVIDVSFISIRQILPHIAKISTPKTMIVAMVKPQFEASRAQLTKTGIVKNDRIRRDILQDFEVWAKSSFRLVDKADSQVAGTHGNRERFYLIKKLEQ